MLRFIVIFSFLIFSSTSADVIFPFDTYTKTFTPLPSGAPAPARSAVTNNYWCAFSTNIPEPVRNQMASMNVPVYAYGKYPGGYVFLFKIGNNYNTVVITLRASGCFVNIEPVLPQDKVDSKILLCTDLFWRDSLRQTSLVTIYFFHPMSVAAIENLCDGLVYSIKYIGTYYQLCVCRCDLFL